MFLFRNQYVLVPVSIQTQEQGIGVEPFHLILKTNTPLDAPCMVKMDCRFDLILKLHYKMNQIWKKIHNLTFCITLYIKARDFQPPFHPPRHPDNAGRPIAPIVGSAAPSHYCTL